MCTYSSGNHSCGCRAIEPDGMEAARLDPCGRECGSEAWIYGAAYEADPLRCAACHGKAVRRWLKLIGRFPRQLQQQLKDEARDRHTLLVRHGYQGSLFYANYESFRRNLVESMAIRAAEWAAMGKSLADIRIANLPRVPNVPCPAANGKIINARGDPECPEGWRPQPPFTSEERNDNVAWTHRGLVV